MIGRALDSNNDLIIDMGQLKLVHDGDEVVQHVRTRLQFYLNEWFLDKTAGVPWFEQVFIKPVNMANVESILKSTILQTPGVNSLTDFAMNYAGESSRTLSVAFNALTDDDQPISSEVTINV